MESINVVDWKKVENHWIKKSFKELAKICLEIGKNQSAISFEVIKECSTKNVKKMCG